MSKWGIDWSQESTKRGFTLLITALIAGGTAIYNGEGSTAIFAVGVAFVGAMGWLRKD